jgi:hypothetical protein
MSLWNVFVLMKSRPSLSYKSAYFIFKPFIDNEEFRNASLSYVENSQCKRHLGELGEKIKIVLSWKLMASEITNQTWLWIGICGLLQDRMLEGKL